MTTKIHMIDAGVNRSNFSAVEIIQNYSRWFMVFNKKIPDHFILEILTRVEKTKYMYPNPRYLDKGTTLKLHDIIKIACRKHVTSLWPCDYWKFTFYVRELKWCSYGAKIKLLKFSMWNELNWFGMKYWNSLISNHIEYGKYFTKSYRVCR